MPDLEGCIGIFTIQRLEVIRERRRPRAGGKRVTLFGLYAFRLLLTLGLSCGDEAAKASVVLDQLNGVDGEAARLRGDVQHGGRLGLVG